MAKEEPTNKILGCPVEYTLFHIGGKWKGVILYHLFEDGILRFGELKRKLPEVTQRMLTKQLRELEESGIIHRKVYQQVPPKVEYSLTEKGKSLEKVVSELAEWGRSYIQ